MDAMERVMLSLKFHGKILDQLGFQTYQSPVASLSELVANGWDADATCVDITLPDGNDPRAEIVIEDNGKGMTAAECQERYLNVGYDCRRGDPLSKTKKGHNVMGRKGIGKFAGFGIAKKILVETTSKKTGEQTTFEMDMEKLRTDEYVGSGCKIPASIKPAAAEKSGTRIVLKELMLARAISTSSFPRSLARRFLVHQMSDNFDIRVNGTPIPKAEDVSGVEFAFPRDYAEGKMPEGMSISDGWGVEKLSNRKVIRWRFYFNKSTIGDEDLQGITVFANGKLVQRPFFFNLSGGLGGQAGQSYMFGQVVADYVDQMEVDPISAERQRVNWELEQTAPLLEWGQARVKRLLNTWHDARGEKKRKMLEQKVSGFATRLEKLGSHERETLKNVLTKIGRISSINQKKYEEVAESIITAWEGGRLRDLWTNIVNSEDLSESSLLDMLIETEVVSALNVAEAVKTKLHAISELKSRIEQRDMENAVRDHLAKNPWIISPKWDTFKKEAAVATIVREMAKKAGLSDDSYRGRVDLVLSSGNQLLVLEFVRPGLPLDWDHVSRCKRYINYIRDAVNRNTAGKFASVHGYIIADKISNDSAVGMEIKYMENHNIVVNDWAGVLDAAKSSWDEYLHILAKRRGGDSRLEKLLDD